VTRSSHDAQPAQKTVQAFWRAGALAHTLHGKWLRGEPVRSAPTGVSIDSRTLAQGHLFVAIHGEQFDGHAFLGEAQLKGACACVVDDEAAVKDAAIAGCSTPLPTLLVRDTRRALADLARSWRKGPISGARLVAVTGSNGKTTTCRLLRAALAQRWSVVASRRSFNNDIGTPLTLLAASPETQYIISEIGASAPGEVAALASIAQPDVACVTNAALAHTQGFGDLAGVVREKVSIAAALRPGGAAYVYADDAALVERVRASAPADARVVTVGESVNADVRVVESGHSWDKQTDDSDRVGVWFTLADGASFTLPFAGVHNARNAAFAVAVARDLGVQDDAIAQALAATPAASMRLAVARVGGVTIINDAYNANPASTVAAIKALCDIAAGAARRVVVLGDLLELGACEEEGLSRVACALVTQHAPSIDVLLAAGNVAARVAEMVGAAPGSAAMRIAFYPSLTDDGEIAREVAASVREGDAVLLKGSRGAQLENVEASLRSKLQQQKDHITHACSTS